MNKKQICLCGLEQSWIYKISTNTDGCKSYYIANICIFIKLKLYLIDGLIVKADIKYSAIEKKQNFK